MAGLTGVAVEGAGVLTSGFPPTGDGDAGTGIVVPVRFSPVKGLRGAGAVADTGAPTDFTEVAGSCSAGTGRNSLTGFCAVSFFDVSNWPATTGTAFLPGRTPV